ncbi:MAG: hypothetical protein ACE366_18535 [Bradymonadia bacterium]
MRTQFYMLVMGLALCSCDDQGDTSASPETPVPDAAMNPESDAGMGGAMADAAVEPMADEGVDPPPDEVMCLEPEEGPLNGACALEDRVGGFLVENQRQFTIVTGDVADSVLPQSVRPEKAREGDCRLLERPNLFCDPPCASGETCDGNQCIPYPAPQDLGGVRIDGLQDCVQMQATPPGNNYFFNRLGRPGFEPGDWVNLVAEGLTLHGRGVAPLEESDEVWLLRRGEPLEVRWSAGNVDDAKVAITISIDQHGASPLSLHCDVADTGMTQVPAALIDRLIDGGVTGAPSGQLSRHTADSTMTEDGCVDFIVASSRARAVRVDGFTFCTMNADCPDGQTCDVPREVCVDE